MSSKLYHFGGAIADGIRLEGAFSSDLRSSPKLEYHRVKPNLLALLVADNVYRDARTGKYIISGTFNKLFFSRTNLNQPVMVDGKQRLLGGMDSGSPYAYLCLSDVAR